MSGLAIVDRWRTTGSRRTATVRTIVDAIEAGTGHSTHSANALTLPAILNELERRRVPYVLFARPGAGYLIRSPYPDDKVKFP